MDGRTAGLLVILGGVGIWLAYQYGLLSSAESAAASLEADVVGWQNVNQGPTWVPVLNAAEVQYGLPTNLLARQAFQESSFLSSVIDGTQPSSAGALGIMQMLPQYFSSVAVPTPFTAADVQAQIAQAAQQMASLYSQFGSWALALAAYNAGAGAVEAAGNQIPPYSETQNYVADILADVPAANA